MPAELILWVGRELRAVKASKVGLMSIASENHNLGLV